MALRSDNQFRKQVAIKILQGGMLNEQMLKRFKFEWQILANLVPQGEPYIVFRTPEGQAGMLSYKVRSILLA